MAKKKAKSEPAGQSERLALERARQVREAAVQSIEAAIERARERFPEAGKRFTAGAEAVAWLAQQRGDLEWADRVRRLDDRIAVLGKKERLSGDGQTRLCGLEAEAERTRKRAGELLEGLDGALTRLGQLRERLDAVSEEERARLWSLGLCSTALAEAILETRERRETSRLMSRDVSLEALRVRVSTLEGQLERLQQAGVPRETAEVAAARATLAMARENVAAGRGASDAGLEEAHRALDRSIGHLSAHGTRQAPAAYRTLAEACWRAAGDHIEPVPRPLPDRRGGSRTDRTAIRKLIDKLVRNQLGKRRRGHLRSVPLLSPVLRALVDADAAHCQTRSRTSST